VDPTTVPQNPVQISFTERHSWRRSSQYCDQTTINSAGTIGAGSVTCVGSSCGSCCSITAAVPCTDFSVSQDVSSGQLTTIINLATNVKVGLTFTGSAWVEKVFIN
ncbi:unnamed protein product, partial [Didymodactylos carnosus]